MAFEEKTRASVSPEQAAAPPTDLLRALVTTLVQETIQAEFARFLGAAPYERTPTRRGHRNGSYPRRLTTRVGSLTLAIPRDRAGLFRSTLFAKYERSEQALVLAMVEMYFHGVSTRKVSAVVDQLCGTSISASEVSALTRKLDASLTAWRERRLQETPYPALVVDAHVEQVRREGHVRATAALWVVGVTPEGYREHLGVWLGPSESEASWGSVFKELVERGLHGVTYVVADDHVGLGAALRRYFPEALVQRCQVHYQRNALSKVSSARGRGVGPRSRDQGTLEGGPRSRGRSPVSGSRNEWPALCTKGARGLSPLEGRQNGPGSPRTGQFRIPSSPHTPPSYTINIQIPRMASSKN
jgi:putative transposase